MLNNQKVKRPDAGLGTANPDVLFTPHHCLHKNTIILTDLGRWGVGKATLSISEGIYSPCSLLKRKEFNCVEKINPKAAKYKGPWVPSERLQDSSKELAPRGNFIIQLRRHRGFGKFNCNSWYFFQFTRGTPCLPSYKHGERKNAKFLSMAF